VGVEIRIIEGVKGVRWRLLESGRDEETKKKVYRQLAAIDAGAEWPKDVLANLSQFDRDKVLTRTAQLMGRPTEATAEAAPQAVAEQVVERVVYKAVERPIVTIDDLISACGTYSKAVGIPEEIKGRIIVAAEEMIAALKVAPTEVPAEDDYDPFGEAIGSAPVPTYPMPTQDALRTLRQMYGTLVDVDVELARWTDNIAAGWVEKPTDPGAFYRHIAETLVPAAKKAAAKA